MSDAKIPSLKIGNLEINKAIVQGGMGVGVSLSGLASAVANAGGLGVISSVALGLLDPKSKLRYREANIVRLKKEIQQAKQLTGGVVGVNIMVAMSDYEALLECAIEEEADIAFLGAGLPLRFPKKYTTEQIKNIKTKFAPIVSSGRAVSLIFRSWEKSFGRIPDAVVVEGPKAGGHLGFSKDQIDDVTFSLENIIPQVISSIAPFEDKYNVKIPVIAAGGIFSGKDIYNILELGADGVQMATRFVATHECDADEAFKQAYVNCKKEDIEIIQSPVGLPGRAIRNTFIEQVQAGKQYPNKCSWKCLKTCDFRKTPYCIADALVNAQQGHLLKGFTFAGANAYKVDKIVSVKDLVKNLEEEYRQEFERQEFLQKEMVA